MNKTFIDWLKEVNRNKRILTIDHGWGKPLREFHFYTKEEVDKNWEEITKSTLLKYSDILSEIKQLTKPGSAK